VIEIDADHFELLVERALEMIPDELASKISNVAVLIEDESPPGQPTLLGLYRGIPLTERGASSYGGVLPDSITIYRLPILAICDSYEAVIAQVRITVVHEVGHYFGIEEERLHELGYG
jgi:predicted Zn-dependent protease with MMP-like domain